MNINEKLLNVISNIQEQLAKVQNLDLENITDLNKAKESIRVIKNDFETLVKESPLYAKVLDIVSKFIDYDPHKDIEKWENIISEKIESIKNSSTFRTEYDKSECCDCDYCSDCCDCADETYNDEEEEYSFTFKDEPLTAEEILDDWVTEDNLESVNVKHRKTIAKLIASYFNNEHSCLDRNDEDELISYLINTLYEFSGYIQKL